MAIDWSKPIRTRLHQHIVVLIRRECRADDQPRRIVRIPGYCLGTFMYREDGAPAMNAPTIENYDPEVENKPVTVDWTKPIQTRDGRPARVLCTDLGSEANCPVVVAVQSAASSAETVTQRPLNGRFYVIDKEHPSDIINVPEKRTVYINFYEDGVRTTWNTREGADKEAASYTTLKRHSRVKVEYTVGQFDI